VFGLVKVEGCYLLLLWNKGKAQQYGHKFKRSFTILLGLGAIIFPMIKFFWPTLNPVPKTTHLNKNLYHTLKDYQPYLQDSFTALLPRFLLFGFSLNLLPPEIEEME